MWGQEATIPRPITTGTGARGTIRASVRLSTATTARLDGLRHPGESRAAAVARIINDAVRARQIDTLDTATSTRP